MLFVFIKAMSFKFRSKAFKAFLAGLCLLIVSTVVYLSMDPSRTVKFAKTELASQVSCSESNLKETSIGQYFEIRQALHFFTSIENSINSQKHAKQTLSSVSVLLDGINQELLYAEDRSRTRNLNKWLRSYSGSDRFKLSQSGTAAYDLPAFYNFVEQDVHGFFHKLLKETLLPENLWVARSQEQIQSLGVRLGEKTWARIGLYPSQWHLHIFKSSAIENGTRPREHFPVQALSLKVLSNSKFELVDGSGKTKLTFKSPEELELVPLCEWLTGEHRKEDQASQRVLKNL